MNIVVTVKQVPDTWAEKKLDPSDMTTDRATVDNVLNEMDEYGVEEALLLKEAHGGEVTAVTMGPDKAVEAVRKALQMGADKGVHLSDPSLHGSDALQTASALAKVIAPLNPDVVIVSSEASDARGWRRRGPARRVPGAASADAGPQGHGRSGRRQRRRSSGRPTTGTPRSRASCRPSWGSSKRSTNPGTRPSRASWRPRRSRWSTMTAADAGIDPGSAGLSGAYSEVDEAQARPPKAAGQVVKDEGDGGAKLAAFLADQKLV